MKIWILTLFEDFFKPLTECGVVGQAFQGQRLKENFKIDIECLDLRKFSAKRSVGVDDTPYGGGPGMVMRADVLKKAWEFVLESGQYGEHSVPLPCFIYTAPAGLPWTDTVARNFAQEFFSAQAESQNQKRDLVFLCGRYEGVDQRFIDAYIERTYCIGDFVLSGGELAVCCLLDSALRFAPGVLGNKLSAHQESFMSGTLEGPQYTRPQIFNSVPVPDVFVSGHHKNIEAAKMKGRKETTEKWRPEGAK